ncbi:uncharacterized protein [Euwallacea similis]|uniref:uncharacterized protein isoform X1 n=1 Tax=Euwallacea similis TaxID=1736056 RepID=UPI00345026A7
MEKKNVVKDNEKPQMDEGSEIVPKDSGVEKDIDAATDATAAEPSANSNLVQNGNISQPEVLENNEDHNSTEEQEQTANVSETEKTSYNKAAEPSLSKKPAVVNVGEKCLRSTRGTKRKADARAEGINTSENESTDLATNETTEQKENVGIVKNNVQIGDDLGEESILKSVSSTDEMGKGKRARVPNKRYSDIILSPNRKSGVLPKLVPENTGKVDEIVVPVVVTPSSSAPFVKRGRGPNTSRDDLQDPKYLKPFKYGWKRELVWRSTSTSTKKMGDIYYYTPTGQKVRSFRELADHLDNKNLSLDNFSYTKDLLGVNDPEKEIEREAKIPQSQSVGRDSPTPKQADIKKNKKVESLKNTATAETGKSVDMPKLITPGKGKKRASANTPEPSPVVKKKKEEARESPATVDSKMERKKNLSSKKMRLSKKSEEVSEAKPSPSQPSRSSPRKTNKPCSMNCEGVQGIIPTLQCRMCLCLYHHQCVGVSPGMGLSYICKDCREEEPATTSTTPLVSPPPLTPINTLKTVTTTASTTLPKLQRIPRTDSSDPPNLQSIPAPPPLVKVNKTVEGPPIQQPSEGCKSLVGSVTSWLPHNSKIVNSEEPAEAPKPQNIEYIGGRKFLVIPKHNVMSVSSGRSFLRSENSVTPNVLQPTELPHISASLGPAKTVDDNDKKMGEDPMDCDDVHEGENRNEAAQQSNPPVEAQPKEVKRNLKLKNLMAHESRHGSIEEKIDVKACLLRDSALMFSSLLHAFQYLKVQDLLRAGCVCHMWRNTANDPKLWKTVRMKNSQVHSFEGLANALKKQGTVHLDLRKMLLPSNGDDIWPDFSKAIAKVESLQKIEFCRCPASVVEQLAISNSNLEVINAVTIKCDSLNLDSFKSLSCISELRLKSTSGLKISSIDSLKELKTLKILSLTSVIDLHTLNLNVIGELTNLVSLDLGECYDFPKNFGEDILQKLDKLEKLRLEKGQGTCHTFEILESVKNMNCLEQLELVNFDVKMGFDRALGACKNIKKLMIIPTYISQSATTNNMVLAGVLRLEGSLSNFVWGVTLELLRVTELFIDQCEDTTNKTKRTSGNGDCIPVLKPVPDLSNGNQIQAANIPAQVEILPLPNLQKLLLNSLPKTRVKILKIPFHATWRQTLTDSL